VYNPASSDKQINTTVEMEK